MTIDTPSGMQKHERLIAIIDILSRARHPLTIVDIRTRLEAEYQETVVPRYVQRDMVDLQKVLGTQIKVQGDRYTGFCYSIKGSSIAKTFMNSVNANQIMAMHILSNLTSVFRGSSIGAEFEQFVDKIRENIVDNDTLGDKAEKIAESVEFLPFGTFDWTSKNGLLNEITTAIAENRRISMIYQTPGSAPTEKKVAPMRLILNKGLPYIAAWDFAAEALKIYSFIRIHTVTIGSTFAITGAMQKAIGDYSKKRFGVFNTQEKAVRIILEFDPMLREQIIHRRWHPSQVITEDKTGRVRLELSLPANEEICSWIFSWQQYVEVIGPVSLRKEIAKRAKGILERHSGK